MVTPSLALTILGYHFTLSHSAKRCGFLSEIFSAKRTSRQRGQLQCCGLFNRHSCQA